MLSRACEMTAADLVGFLGEWKDAGVDLYLDRQGVDTSTPAGKALFQMLGVFAEFERSIIQERIAAGIARARAQGTRSGKPIGRARIAPSREEAIRAAGERQGHFESRPRVRRGEQRRAADQG
jgi:DNA invertase Pin-like site-specific DNA recombinase